ncbi:hypothetical protein VagYM19_22940 [Vibrio alginolyticus]|uniref:YfdX family protein n=1 Tax=Vibrio TaxID=662 RepID=UPI0003ED957E|nr:MULTISPECIES: YfdX family protein [Vibrio]EKF9437431.1 YfdX family protein [Vibrio cholerae]TBT35784.1 hypothetical protein D5E85_07820 [Vibrio parahaemolyticus]BCB43164.1 hypothetical protein Vag1382_22910 [Vibrio alginolyticus]AHI98736.1 hypothetical protein VPUCM_0778 [Vibrio parahaemolyticus UCM-V493]BCB47765.1 hypothetical protein VagVIO5_22910 [Vibrio alginolyticus]
MKHNGSRNLLATVLGLSIAIAMPTWAEIAKPEEQSKTAQAIQDQVDLESAKQAAENRKKITKDAISAVQESKNALKLLDENKVDEALAALERVTGKLELIIARDPKLAFAPIDVAVNSYDLIALPETVKKVVEQAENHLEEYEVQAARKLLENLVSEIVISTTSIPLATYPQAIKATVPLIDKGKINEAKQDLQLALNTLVVTDRVIPLPVLRAETLLKDAEELSEKKERTEGDNENLESIFTEIQTQLEMAELLGYGKKSDFKTINEELEKIKRKLDGNKSGTGWYDKVKKQISDLF